eukprot:scaffold185602_cov29-Prasinocladus_malaysianus.AAC.2
MHLQSPITTCLTNPNGTNFYVCSSTGLGIGERFSPCGKFIITPSGATIKSELPANRGLASMNTRLKQLNSPDHPSN